MQESLLGKVRESVDVIMKNWLYRLCLEWQNILDINRKNSWLSCFNSAQWNQSFCLKLQSNFIEITLRHGVLLYICSIFSEDLFLITPLEGCFCSSLEVNAIWRTQYFYLYCLNTTVCKFNNFNIFGTANTIKKTFV